MITLLERRIIAERETRNEAQRVAERAKWAMKKAEVQVVYEEGKRLRSLVDSEQVKVRYNDNYVVVTLFCLDKTPIVQRFERMCEQEIGRALLRLQQPTRKWADGTIRGLKKLKLKDGKYVSPAQGTVWHGDEMSEPLWPTDPGEVLRGHVGIHAVWPDKAKELVDYQGVLVEVAGFGECVVGDLGWRSQFARVVRRLI